MVRIVRYSHPVLTFSIIIGIKKIPSQSGWGFHYGVNKIDLLQIADLLGRTIVGVDSQDLVGIGLGL